MCRDGINIDNILERCWFQVICHCYVGSAGPVLSHSLHHVFTRHITHLGIICVVWSFLYSKCDVFCYECFLVLCFPSFPSQCYESCAKCMTSNLYLQKEFYHIGITLLNTTPSTTKILNLEVISTPHRSLLKL